MEDELWTHTFHELGWLTERWRLVQARQDRRAALAAWVLASVHRDPESRSEPFDFAEVVGWLGHGFDRLAAHPESPPEPPTADELLERARLLNEVYGGITHNGTGDA